MISSLIFILKLVLSFLPFVLFIYFNSKANAKREVRHTQYIMPVVALAYSIVLMTLLNWLTDLCSKLFSLLAKLFKSIGLGGVGKFINNLYESMGMFLTVIVFNILALVLFVIIKRIITAIFSKKKVDKDSFIGSVVGLFYTYDEQSEKWYIQEHYGQARTYVKVAYFGGCFVTGIAFFISVALALSKSIASPFYPVFAIIVIGEIAFFLDGLRADEQRSGLKLQADNSKRIAMYPLLRKPLKALFGDKLSADGTTVNNSIVAGGVVEDILADLEKSGGHIGKNYALFIRSKMDAGFKPNVDYVRSGYDLATGKSLLFNTPFYDKLNPYAFYAMNRELLTGGKVLIVLGRHGTEQDLLEWSKSGMLAVSNIPDLWKIQVLSGQKYTDEILPDIGIISHSGVHDLDVQKNNLQFLQKVSFVLLVEPSRLVTTAQLGLNLLVKSCGKERDITFCSVDRNCDGLVDSLSHILMTNITEVSATEYPHGMSSYMYWTADDDYLQHRILPGVSRCLGMGTELSMVALRNQVKKTVWYGGESYPVKDAHWIAKQYYYNLLEFAQLPTNQETFDRCFQTSFNMCDERVSDYSFITVEDDRNNLFETRRSFATIAEQQGFVNVISSEYMLREYMADNTELFTTDAKAIPYITADYARTKRNAILSLCLLMCIDSVPEDVLKRQMLMLNIGSEDPVEEIWKEICLIFGEGDNETKCSNILSVKCRNGKTITFEKNKTVLFKREYSVESGKFESVYKIENVDFSRIILDDLQNATYIAEKESDDVYIGTELKGHVYQKYMPGQFFTLNGKYYEMISTTADNRILVRRASEHIGGRLAYRQVRNYAFHRLYDSSSMGSMKTVNNIDIHYQYADFSVETPGYWKLLKYNDFDNGDLVKINGVPTREYHHKQILKFDFSKLGDSFTDSVRMTLTNLLNESFVTLFAENQPFISAITPGQYDAPLTYSLNIDEEINASDKCIYIVEDSQLDIGLLIAVERNVNRIFQVISDYLSWNSELIEKSIEEAKAAEENAKAKAAAEEAEAFDAYEEGEQQEQNKKKNIFARIAAWFKGLFKKKKTKDDADEPIDDSATAEETDNEVEQTTSDALEAIEEGAEDDSVDTAEEDEVAAETESDEEVDEEAVEETTVEETAAEEETIADEETETDEEASIEETAAEDLADAMTVPTEGLTPKQQRKAEKKAQKLLKKQQKAEAKAKKAEEKAAAKAKKAEEKAAAKAKRAEEKATEKDKVKEDAVVENSETVQPVAEEIATEEEPALVGTANEVEVSEDE